MNADFPTNPHPHAGRRLAALSLASVSLATWLSISMSLWHANIAHHWLHHVILFVGALGAFLAPCFAVWALTHGYDRARRFRGL